MPQTLRTILTPLASLKLTVTLFVLAMVLIFAGTLAQRELGNWDVVYRYFRAPNADYPSPIVMIPLRHLVFFDVPGAIPFPGGMILGGLLLANLLAAHAVRFRMTWKRAGVLVIHAGLIVLLLGEAVTAFAASEGMMVIPQGGSTRFAEDLREVELAIVHPPSGGDGQPERVTVVPQWMLERSAATGEPITDPALPLTLQVRHWMPNSELVGPMQPVEGAIRDVATVGHGTRVGVLPRPTVAGASGMEVDHPAAFLDLDRNGEQLGTLLVTNHFGNSTMFTPRQTVEIGGETYAIELRFRRTYRPYTVHVLETRHDKFVGTEIPRNFSSRVRIDDPEVGETREALIRMNQPLRYRGDTLYQSQMGQMASQDGAVPFTGLQVVRNPGWLMPYVSCVLVAAGMILHFGLMLWNFSMRTLT